MMDFISVPLVVGIVCAGIYGLFELFVRKRERLAIIEKIGDKLDTSLSMVNWDCLTTCETSRSVA